VRKGGKVANKSSYLQEKRLKFIENHDKLRRRVKESMAGKDKKIVFSQDKRIGRRSINIGGGLEKKGGGAPKGGDQQAIAGHSRWG